MTRSQPEKLKPGKTPQEKYEKRFLEEKMKDFDPLKSKAWAKLTERFGKKITKERIESLAEVVAHMLKIELTREYKRRKETLIKWFDENLDVVWPYIVKNVQVS